MLVASLSGIRGVFNKDLLSSDILRFCRNFSNLDGSEEVLVGRDTRSTGTVISRMVSSALLREGLDVLDYEVISTPALFRESRLKKRRAIVVTASHNDPEWNGLKFIVNGRLIQSAELEQVLEERRYPRREVASGSLTHQEGSSYNEELVSLYGEGTCEGVRVALDLNGGAASKHAPRILQRLGCEVISLGDSPSLFMRTIDPTADALETLRKVVVSQGAQIGLAFDCDGDRLVVVDNQGLKRSGDFMLTLAMKEILARNPGASIVVSVDTTQAISELVNDAHGTLYESKVGEVSVLQMMTENGATYGGEGSSGGLIDTSFNSCRDSMVAAITIIKALKSRGTKIYSDVKSYFQSRVKLEIRRAKADIIIKKLKREYPDSTSIDGIKVRPSQTSWVLVRASGTEDVLRISAEAHSAKEAEELTESFARKVKKVGALT